jgi:hypothetical protein
MKPVPGFPTLITVSIILAVFQIVSFFCVPPFAALAFRYDYTVIPLLLAALYGACTYAPEKLGTMLFFNLVLWACWLPLPGLWKSGLSESFILGGIMPFSDAGGYYIGAVKLLNWGQLDYFCARRPLFPGLLASVLGLTKGDLRFTLIILVALAAACLYLAVREVQRDCGYAAGCLMFLLLWLFYRRFIGAAVTENLGLAMGCLGFVALWRSARQASRGYGILGLFLLAVALCARAGAFFALPALVLWGTWVFRGEKRFSASFFCGGTIAVAAAFALDALLRRVISPPGAPAFSNLSYCLYGLLVGGDWTVVFTQHPELRQLVEPELPRRIYALALAMLKEHPLWLFAGILRAWKQALWFPRPEHSLFGFFIIMNPPAYPCLGIYRFLLAYILPLVNGLALIGFLRLFRRRREARDLLLLAVAAGLLLSLPFARLEDADNMRAYAATLPFIALLPVLGLQWLLGKLVRVRPLAQVAAPGSWLPLAGLAAVLIALSAVAPMAMGARAEPPGAPATSCPQGLAAARIWFSPGSSLFLSDDSRSSFLSRGNVVALQEFRENMTLFQQQYPDLAANFLELPPSTTIALSPGVVTEPPYLFLVFDNTRVQMPPGSAAICGFEAFSKDSWGLFRVEAAHPVK